MLTVCWSVKGGSGTSVVAAAIALQSPRRSQATTLIDLAGDQPALCGLSDPSGAEARAGINDWVANSTVGPEVLDALALTVSRDLRLVPAGECRARLDHPRWAQLADCLADSDGDVVVDAGLRPPRALIEVAHQSLLVTRCCYLALRNVAPHSIRPSGVVVITEPGRSITSMTVAAVAMAPVVAEIPLDPAVARRADTGMVAGRLPSALRGLARVAA
ncbi:MAG TPA: hypothetical protein PLV68_07055 [Ilumatobacteraceae bacterium]|nr:hypothetical protein [Ilumatobacteraceae bacterium]